MIASFCWLVAPPRNYLANSRLPSPRLGTCLAFYYVFDDQPNRVACSTQLPNEVFESLIPLLATFLAHKQPVVHTYAATAIERILALKNATPAAGAASLRFSPERLAPFVQPLLTGEPCASTLFFFVSPPLLSAYPPPLPVLAVTA